MDRLTSLTVFSRVVETGGFSAAARRLNMSVTAVSNHMQALEKHLGVRLLNRTTRRISLTEIGRAYHERINGVLTELNDADRLASAGWAALNASFCSFSPRIFVAAPIGVRLISHGCPAASP